MLCWRFRNKEKGWGGWGEGGRQEEMAKEVEGSWLVLCTYLYSAYNFYKSKFAGTRHYMPCIIEMCSLTVATYPGSHIFTQQPEIICLVQQGCTCASRRKGKNICIHECKLGKIDWLAVVSYKPVIWSTPSASLKFCLAFSPCRQWLSEKDFRVLWSAQWPGQAVPWLGGRLGAWGGPPCFSSRGHFQLSM